MGLIDGFANLTLPQESPEPAAADCLAAQQGQMTTGEGALAGAAKGPAAEPVLCGHCGRTANNGLSCQGICVADSGY